MSACINYKVCQKHTLPGYTIFFLLVYLGRQFNVLSTCLLVNTTPCQFTVTARCCCVETVAADYSARR